MEWTLGLLIPILVAGPICEFPLPGILWIRKLSSNHSDYVNQGARFQVIEGFGCSILDVITGQCWAVVPPLISIVFYYREPFCPHRQPRHLMMPRIALARVVRTYYRQRRDIDSFLHSNPSVSHTNYLRILVLASIDIVLTLPIGIVSTTLEIVEARFSTFFSFLSRLDLPPHQMGAIRSFLSRPAGRRDYLSCIALLRSMGIPVLAFAIFGLFGVTLEARASYWRIICTICGWFGWKPTPRARNGQASLGDIEFGARPAQDTSGYDLEMGYVLHALLAEAPLTFLTRLRPPSFINTDIPPTSQSAAHTMGGSTGRESETDLKSVDEVRRDLDVFVRDADSPCVYLPTAVQS